jgi:hypothetical protein
METVELRRKMQKLWKDTFHDSDAYIQLIFDNYFDPEFVEYYEENGKLISALIAIPYELGNSRASIKGMYLCGLATAEDYRHRGIMNNLMAKINDKATAEGYAISFLIPASDTLRIYYQDKGYCNAMYRVEDRYTDVHNFANDCSALLDKEEERLREVKRKYYDKIQVNIIDKSTGKDVLEALVDYIQTSEHKVSNYVSLFHSKTDLIAVIEENIISGGKCYISQNTEGVITGAMFVTFDDRKRVIIPKLYCSDKYSYYKLLDKVKQQYPESGISIYCYPEETDRKALWSPVYGAVNPDGGMLGGSYGVAERVYNVNLHTTPYGMAKILNLHEILKFVATQRKDLKFSILVKASPEAQTGTKYDVESGKVRVESVEPERIKDVIRDKEVTSLTERDLSEILFRKKDSNTLIMDALGIPRMAINMCLLLD